jgi:hypothetical protein
MELWNKERAHSRYDAAWAARCRADYPVTALTGNDGTPNGNFRFFGRLMFPALFKATKKEGAPGQPTYKANCMTLPGYDISLIRQAADQKTKERWPNGTPRGWKPAIRPQDDRLEEMEGGLRGMQVGGFIIPLSANSKIPKKGLPEDQWEIAKPPLILSGHTREVITDETEIYPGCWGYFVGSPYTYPGQGSNSENRGTQFNLVGFIKCFDDDAVGGGNRVSKDAMLAGIAAPAPQVNETDYSFMQ